MSDVVSLAEARAEKACDATLWTPLDMVRALLRDIESGEIKPEQIVVHYLYKNEDETQSHGFYAAGISYLEHVGLLAVAHNSVMKNWVK